MLISLGAVSVLAILVLPLSITLIRLSCDVGPDTSKGLLISLGGVFVLAIVLFSISGKSDDIKQVADAASKVKDLNEFGPK